MFSRLNQLNKINIRHSRTANSGLQPSTLAAAPARPLFLLTLRALIAGFGFVNVNFTLAHAEPEAISNVLGEEIIIHDESSKLAPLNATVEMPTAAPVSSVAKTPNKKSSTSNITNSNAATSNSNTATSNSNTATSANSAPSVHLAPNYDGALGPNYNGSEAVSAKPKPNLRINDPIVVQAINKTAADKNADIETDRDDLWQRIKSGYGIPESISPLTKNHEQWYSSRPDYVKRMVERSQRYLFHVVEEVEKRGMPSEIALLPMIESAYNPKAYSTSRASGIWQFIPSTGKHFGLKQNWWFDNRRNITFATDAALTYLQKLHAMFGAWDLALAAYNAGEGTVSRAIERNRKLGLPTDYESLNLPAETRNYVPKLQAVKNIMTNPSNYGLNIQTIANTPYFAKVTAPAQIDAHLAAKLAEISDEEFLALNPSFNRPLIKSEEKNLELLLPIMSAQTFRDNLENHNKPLVSWQTYFAKRGERLEKIASQFGIHVKKLRDVNDLPASGKMKQPTTILVPNGKVTDFKPNANSAKTTSAISVNNTETQSASTFEQNISGQRLAGNAENLDADFASNEIEPNTPSNVTHKVAKGESIFGIAKRYGLTIQQLKADNGLKSNRLRTGQKLIIGLSDSKTVSSKAISSKTISGETTTSENKNIKTYIVKRGDTLHSIAEKFDVAVVDLKRWNNINSNHIEPGSQLTILQPDAV